MKPSYDEYEEVASPFSSNSNVKTASREKLRARKNVFNRPFATSPSVAPAVFETSGTRKSIGHPDMTDMTHHRMGSLDQTEVEYLSDEGLAEEEEEYQQEPEVIEKRPTRVNTAAKKKSKPQNNILSKLGWSVIGLLVLRLILMDRGVWDYFATEGAIKERQNELQSIKRENKEIESEISRIQLDKNYQRNLAKEHLGVIAADEFLILFAGESTETSSVNGRQL